MRREEGGALKSFFYSPLLPSLQDGRTALHCAAYMGRLSLVAPLVEAGAVLDAPDKVRVRAWGLGLEPLLCTFPSPAAGGQYARGLGGQVVRA